MPNFSGIWTVTQQMQAKGASTWPATPGAPTIGTATAGNSLCASVTFTAPGCTGYPASITEYRVISTPGCITQTGASSPLTVTGLTLGTSYTFKARATNATGNGPCSSASNSITATQASCATFTSSGTYTWIAPAGVTSVAVLVVGGGGGAGGFYGAGTAGGDSSFNSSIFAYGGKSGSSSGGCGGGGAGGNGGGTGGQGKGTSGSGNPVGGGAAGYTGNGGDAGCYGVQGGGKGGGVGIYGQGANGSGGSPGGQNGSGGGGGGGGGSNGGSQGTDGQAGSGGSGQTYGGGFGGGTGGGMGGGGGGLRYGNNVSVTPSTGYTVIVGARGSSGVYGANGGPGAARIVWAVCGIRGTPSFPSTNVGP